MRAFRRARPMSRRHAAHRATPLKTIIAMGFALDGECGETVIESRGVEHRIVFAIDPIRQEPRIDHVTGATLCK